MPYLLDANVWIHYLKQPGNALEADEAELLLLAEKVPETIKRRTLQRPEAFLRIADLDDHALDQVLNSLPSVAKKSRVAR